MYIHHITYSGNFSGTVLQ